MQVESPPASRWRAFCIATCNARRLPQSRRTEALGLSGGVPMTILQNTTKGWERDALSRYQKRRRMALAFVLLLTGGVLLFVSSVDTEGWLHEYVEAVGLGLISVGILGRLWCTLYIGGRKADDIVTTGPYSLSRNPLYVFSAIAAAGVGAQTGSIVISVLFLIVAALAFHVVIRREERYLEPVFGEPYRAYCRRVPRFLPSFRNFDAGGPMTFLPSRLHRTFTDGLVFFLALPVLESVEYAQETGLLPVFLHLY